MDARSIRVFPNCAKSILEHSPQRLLAFFGVFEAEELDVARGSKLASGDFEVDLSGKRWGRNDHSAVAATDGGVVQVGRRGGNRGGECELFGRCPILRVSADGHGAAAQSSKELNSGVDGGVGRGCGRRGGSGGTRGPKIASFRQLTRFVTGASRVWGAAGGVGGDDPQTSGNVLESSGFLGGGGGGRRR